MSALNKLFGLLPLAFLTACASVTSPSGGPKDETKPVLVKTSPETGTRNFKGKIITLSFNEDVQPKDLNKQLIITPNTGNAYSVRNSGKEVEIEFEKNLDENTTYFLNFQEGIVDITESNPGENVKVAFSTGAELDSGKVNGTVTDYLSNKPETGITVGLYPEADTANIKAKAPYYFTKTNSAGEYDLQNIKAGNYWIFAHNDKNDNQYYDQGTEKIGYLPQTICIGAKPLKQNLKTVIIDAKKAFIVSTQNFTDKNTLIFNEGILEYSFKTLESTPKNLKLIAVMQPNGKALDVYPENGKLPEHVLIQTTDSSYNQGIDTVKFNLVGKPGISKIMVVKLKEDKATLQKGDLLEIEFPVPIQITKPQPLTITLDSVKEVKPTFPAQYTLSPDRTILKYNMPITATKSIQVKSDSTAIVAVNNTFLKKINLLIPVLQGDAPTGTGSIAGSIKTDYKSFILEFIDEKSKVIKTVKNAKTFQFRNLAPGTYSILVKIDENNNGKWEIGDKTLKRLPEKLYRYPKPITVRANWDIEDLVIQF